MRWGICISIENTPAMKSAGWDFVEVNAQQVLQGLAPDHEWIGSEQARQAVLPLLCANVMVPPSLKITGPDADMNVLRAYITAVMERAAKVGMEMIVFGSGGARNVPDGFDRDRARRQIIEFARMSADLAARHNITIVIEPLNRGECNIINTVAEAVEYAREVNHPHLQCLVDSYHLWKEDEPLENLRRAMPWIRHVHLADLDGRVAPGRSGSSDYRPFFSVLKEGGYDGAASVEATKFDVQADGKRVLEFVKRQWHEC